jgi:hypothetical protein
MPSKVMSRRALAALAGLTFVLQSGRLCAGERLTAAFYCPADDISFIGELMTPIVSVLEDQKVRTELGLSDDQLEKMTEIEKAYDAGIRGGLSGADGRTGEFMKGGGTTEGYVLAVGKMSEETRRKTNDVLKRKQMQRMQEIVLQLYGVLFVPKKELRQMLDLNREQERGIDEIKSRVFAKIDGTAAPGQVTVAANRCRFAKLAAPDVTALLRESEQAAKQLLNPEQVRTVEKFKGEPFTP